MTALLATELALALPVGSLNVPASVAPLRRVAGIDPDHAAADRLCLVFQKRAELTETPGVQPSLSIVLAALHAGPDVRQLLNNNRTARRQPLEDRLGEHVIAVA